MRSSMLRATQQRGCRCEARADNSQLVFQELILFIFQQVTVNSCILYDDSLLHPRSVSNTKYGAVCRSLTVSCKGP